MSDEICELPSSNGPSRFPCGHGSRRERIVLREEYSFAPATINAKAGDVLVFRVAGGGNHGVSFETGMPAAARAALNAAMPGRVGDLRSPLLARGAEYRIVIPANMPAGRYRFFCLPHRAYDEVGYLVIQ